MIFLMRSDDARNTSMPFRGRAGELMQRSPRAARLGTAPVVEDAWSDVGVTVGCRATLSVVQQG